MVTILRLRGREKGWGWRRWRKKRLAVSYQTRWVN